MKVCDVVQAYVPTGGGIRTYVDRKREFFRDRDGARHVLVTPAAHDSVRRSGGNTHHTVRAPCIPGHAPYRFWLRPGRVASILEAERPDVIELGSPYLMPWVAFSHRARTGTPIVGFYHTDLPDVYAGAPFTAWFGHRVGRGARSGAAAYVKALYGRCDLVVSASPRLVRRLRALGCRNVAYLPLGFDRDTFSPRHRDERIRRELAPRHSVLLMYAGRLDREKGVPEVVEAWRRLPPDLDAALILVGEGPLRSSLEAEARQQPGLRIVPFQRDPSALAGLLASADVYVTAFRHETFGLSVIEAQACGLPVVGYRAGALSERVDETRGLLAEPRGPGELAAAITSLVRNGRVERGRRARQHVVEHFEWSRTFHRLVELYESAIDTSRV